MRGQVKRTKRNFVSIRRKNVFLFFQPFFGILRVYSALHYPTKSEFQIELNSQKERENSKIRLLDLSHQTQRKEKYQPMF